MGKKEKGNDGGDRNKQGEIEGKEGEGRNDEDSTGNDGKNSKERRTSKKKENRRIKIQWNIQKHNNRRNAGISTRKKKQERAKYDSEI